MNMQACSCVQASPDYAVSLLSAVDVSIPFELTYYFAIDTALLFDIFS